MTQALTAITGQGPGSSVKVVWEMRCSQSALTRLLVLPVMGWRLMRGTRFSPDEVIAIGR